MEGKAIGRSEVELVLRKAVKKDVHLLDFELQPFGSKVGFMGDHSTLVVHYSDASDAQPMEHTFFVKKLPEGNERYKNFILDRGLFAKEKEMYQKLLPMMSEALRRQMPVAECYLIGDESYVIFEDLRRMGYKLVDKLPYLQVGECEAALRAVAMLHAGSLAVEIKSGKLMPFHADHCYEALIADNSSDNIVSRQWHNSSLETAFALLQKMQCYKSRLADANWDAVYQRLHVAWEQCAVAANGNSSGYRNVLSHGDLWINNVLLRHQPAAEAVLVDFQIYRYAPPAIDLLMFLHLTTSRQFRREHLGALLKFYHNNLVEFLTQAGISEQEIPISLQELQKSASEFQTFAVVIAAR